MDLLRKIIASPAVRKALVALVLAVAAAAGFSLGSGCSAASYVPPAVAKARAVLECQVAAFTSVVPLAVAEDVVMALRAGNHEYAVRQLLALGLTLEDVRQVADQFNACVAPSSDAGPTVEQN